ncbi:hypothetical protein [Methanobrevibacter sp.]|uniref:hypothetical protein n=1 Tax=Methanobrevibacter sp. TaxID=66852 RepID=UPI0025D9A4BF|nr:hypothetical protein [uncultured Methanobrevibacter sp.]
MSFLDTFKEWSTGKKILSVVGVCCVLLIIFAVVGGFGSTDKNTSSDTSSSGTVEDTPALQLKITTDGSWSGSVLVGGSSKSIDGSGSQTIDLDGDSWDMVSATIQKQGGDNGDLTVQIIKDGNVAKEESTTAAYGVVSVVD